MSAGTNPASETLSKHSTQTQVSYSGPARNSLAQVGLFPYALPLTSAGVGGYRKMEATNQTHLVTYADAYLLREGGPVINLFAQNYHSDFCVHKHLRHVTAEHTHLAKSFFGHSYVALLQNCLVGLSCGTLLYDILVGHSCGTLLCNTLARHSCRTLLSDILVGHSCGTHLFVTLARHSCRTLLRNSLVGHSCGTLLHVTLVCNTLVGHSCRTLLWAMGHSCRTVLLDTLI